MTMHAAISFLARLLLASIFLVSAGTTLSSYSASSAYFTSLGIPAAALPVVLGVQIVCGAVVAAGVFTRTAAGMLAVLALVTALVFHRQLSVDNNLVDFMKNLAIAGGLLMLVANGPGKWALREGSAGNGKPPQPKQPPQVKLVASTAEALVKHRARR